MHFVIKLHYLRIIFSIVQIHKKKRKFFLLLFFYGEMTFNERNVNNAPFFFFLLTLQLLTLLITLTVTLCVQLATLCGAQTNRF